MILRETLPRPTRPGTLAAAVAFTLLIGSCGGEKAGPSPSGRDAGSDRTGRTGTDGRTTTTGDGGVPPGCTLPALAGDLTHNWDVHLAMVSGTITLGGAALPDSPGLGSRGQVVFRERTTNDVRALPVGGTGPAAFSGSLFAGSYDVSFEAVAAATLIGIPPAGKARLASAVTITGRQTLAYDLSLATVTGTITAGGAALPDSPTLTTRGNLVLREQQSGDVRGLSVGATGPGAFSGTLFAGSYDVSFETVSGTALVGLPASAETRVATGVALSGSQTLAYDVQVASVSGAITAGGAALPDSPTLATRGTVLFRERQSGDLRSFAVPAIGPGLYGGMLFAGTYDVSYQSPPDVGLVGQSGVVGLIGLPAASTTRLATSTRMTGTARLDYDLPIATVTGTITASGSPLPDSPTLTTRGSVRFLERATGLTSSFALGGTGPGAFTGMLFAGTYDVSFAGSAATGLVGLPPNGSKRLAAAAVIAGSATPIYDLPVTTVSGTITAAGAALPGSPALTNRGHIVFRDRDTGVAARLPVGATGSGAFAGSLYASSYDVTFETVDSPDLIGLPRAAETRLRSGLAVAGNQSALGYDIRVINVSGRVTMDGAPLPDSPTLTTRGNLLLRDKLTGDLRALPLAATGPGTFSGIAFAASYDVALETSGVAGLVGLPPGAETNLDVGCLSTGNGGAPGGVPGTPGCESDPGDLTGNWTFTFRDQASWLRWNVSLTEAGPELGGRFVAASGYTGQFDSGRRTGNTIALSSTQNTATCVLRIDAIVSDGCFMSGLGSCASGVSQSPFIGTR